MSTLKILVVDNEPGIRCKVAASAIDTMHSYSIRRDVKNSLHYRNTLKLSIVKKLTESYGGTIEVTSTPDQGSTFIVTLPKT